MTIRTGSRALRAGAAVLSMVVGLAISGCGDDRVEGGPGTKNTTTTIEPDH